MDLNKSTSGMCDETDFCNKSNFYLVVFESDSEKSLLIIAIIFLLFITWVFNCCNLCSSVRKHHTNSEVIIDNDNDTV